MALFHNRSQREYFYRKRVNAHQNVKDYYLGDGVGYIFCRIRAWDELIDHYSVGKYINLEEDFVRYLISNASFIPLEYPLALVLCGMEMDAAQQELVRGAVEGYFVFETGGCQERLRRSTHRALTTFLIGVCFFLLNLAAVTSGMSLAVTNVVNILYWFFWLESAGEFWKNRGILLDEKAAMSRLATAQVVFRPEFADTPLSEAECADLERRIRERRL